MTLSDVLLEATCATHSYISRRNNGMTDSQYSLCRYELRNTLDAGLIEINSNLERQHELRPLNPQRLDRRLIEWIEKKFSFNFHDNTY